MEMMRVLTPQLGAQQQKGGDDADGAMDGDVLLISSYELGHQPAGVSVPMGFLRREGIQAAAMDISVEGFDAAKATGATFIGVSVPMHTALRLGVSVAREIRRLNPDCHICFYGLYASLNADYLLDTVADSIIGGEFEKPLTELVKAVLTSKHTASMPPVPQSFDIPTGVKTRTRAALPVLERLNFAVPERDALPSLKQYARLAHDGEERLTGYVEASRGCLHHCTHCPIPPVYGGRFFVVPPAVVMEDIRALVARGAGHITFGDPDFLNGPTHALRLARALHEEFPRLTFDFTAKVEHILKHRERFPEFAELGCAFVVSAVESLSDAVLAHLEKGHTRADVAEALTVVRGAGIAFRPSLVSFTPWTTLDDFIDVLDFVEAEGLIDAVDPVQYSIRLLVPPGSLLLKQADTSVWLGALNQEQFTYGWTHTDPRVDELQKQVAAIVEGAARTGEDAAETFYRIRELACRLRGDEVKALVRAHLAATRIKPPRLTEAWFC